MLNLKTKAVKVLLTYDEYTKRKTIIFRTTFSTFSKKKEQDEDEVESQSFAAGFVGVWDNHLPHPVHQCPPALAGPTHPVL